MIEGDKVFSTVESSKSEKIKSNQIKLYMLSAEFVTSAQAYCALCCTSRQPYPRWKRNLVFRFGKVQQTNLDL